MTLSRLHTAVVVTVLTAGTHAKEHVRGSVALKIVPPVTILSGIFSFTGFQIYAAVTGTNGEASASVSKSGTLVGLGTRAAG